MYITSSNDWLSDNKVSDNKLLKKYKKIWERVGNLLNIEFDSELFMVM